MSTLSWRRKCLGLPWKRPRKLKQTVDLLYDNGPSSHSFLHVNSVFLAVWRFSVSGSVLNYDFTMARFLFNIWVQSTSMCVRQHGSACACIAFACTGQFNWPFVVLSV